MRKKKNNVTNWRNEKKDIFAILGDNKKFLMPAILVVAVIITVVIAVSANHRATEIAANTATEARMMYVFLFFIYMCVNCFFSLFIYGDYSPFF